MGGIVRSVDSRPCQVVVGLGSILVAPLTLFQHRPHGLLVERLGLHWCSTVLLDPLLLVQLRLFGLQSLLNAVLHDCCCERVC